MPEIRPTVAFADDGDNGVYERDVFDRVASASILCDCGTEGDRLRIVRRASQGEALTPDEIDRLCGALACAIEDRAGLANSFEEWSKPDLAEAAAQWLGPLRKALLLALDARDLVTGVIR